MTSGGAEVRDRSAFVVLAGGDSRRMGRDKAFLRVEGREMLERLLAVGRSACAGCVLAGGDPAPHAAALRRYGWEATGPASASGPRGFRRGDAALRLVTDRRPGLGPVAGLEAGLAAADAPLCFVAACDLPFLPVPVVTALLGELDALRDAAGGAPGDPPGRAVVPVADGRRQPLAAAYTAGCAAAARRCVEEGELSMDRLLGRLAAVRTVEAADVLPGGAPEPGGGPERWFANVNRPEDLRAARDSAPTPGAGTEEGAGP